MMTLCPFCLRVLSFFTFWLLGFSAEVFIRGITVWLVNSQPPTQKSQKTIIVGDQTCFRKATFSSTSVGPLGELSWWLRWPPFRSKQSRNGWFSEPAMSVHQKVFSSFHPITMCVFLFFSVRFMCACLFVGFQPIDIVFVVQSVKCSAKYLVNITVLVNNGEYMSTERSWMYNFPTRNINYH